MSAEELTFNEEALAALFALSNLRIQPQSPFKGLTAKSPDDRIKQSLIARGVVEIGGKVNAAMKSALTAAARPEHEIVVRTLSLNDVSEQRYLVADGKVVIAQRIDGGGFLSRPQTIAALCEGLLRLVGPAPLHTPDLQNLKVNRDVVEVLSRLFSAGMGVTDKTALTGQAVSRVFQGGDKSATAALLQGLTTDGLLVAQGTKYRFADATRGWLEAWSTGTATEIALNPLRDATMKGTSLKTNAASAKTMTFVGAVGAQRLMWNADDGDIILCRPDPRVYGDLLKSFLGEHKAAERELLTLNRVMRV